MSGGIFYDEGGVQIWHGDCRDVLPGLPRHGAGLMVTDPPYGQNYRSGHPNRWHGNPEIAGDDGTLDVLAALRLALDRVRLRRHFYVFGPLDVTSLTTSATTELVWDKGEGVGMGDLCSPWASTHERITFGTWSPYPSGQGSGGLAARLRRGSVLRVNSTNAGQGARLHPTEKPVALLRQLIEMSSLFDEVVLDPFAGAGSTLEAAMLEGRRAVGIEVDERYCETAAKRLGRLSSQGVLDLNAVAT